MATGAIDVNSAGRDLLAATSGGTVNTYMGGLIRDEVLTNGRFADQADMESRLSTIGRFGTSEIADIRSLFASGTYVI